MQIRFYLLVFVALATNLGCQPSNPAASQSGQSDVEVGEHAASSSEQATSDGERGLQAVDATELRKAARAEFWQGYYEEAFKKSAEVCKLENAGLMDFVLHGEICFANGSMEECVAAYDEIIRKRPDLEPGLWQRGLALYYANEFEEGVRQFETHQTVNSKDVENAVWHLLCAARIADVETAQKKLIPIEGDDRIPMTEIYELFAGRSTVEKVAEAAQRTSEIAMKGTKTHYLQLYYGHLYTGLYHDMMGEQDLATAAMKEAVKINPLDGTNFMGQVARVHLEQRERESELKK